jgi:signal transduction histidine kinase
MKRVRAYHVVFGLALAVLGALGAWWTVFFLRSVELERTAERNELVHASVVTALMLGQRAQPPARGTRIPSPIALEVIDASQRRPGDLFSPLVPNFPNLGVRPDGALIQRIEDRTRRRRWMLIGEGGLLFLLLGVCTFMLYRLVRSERRHMRRMQTFLSTVTHEMKTPLAGLKSMLQTFAADRVPADQRAMLYAMGLKEAERLEHMVENVLIAGRLRSEAYQVYNESTQLRPLLDGFIAHRRRYLVGRPEAVDLVWEASQEDVRVLCDRNALHVVLENLTDNALKYGGEQPVVRLRVRSLAAGVEIAVEDSGAGFDPAKARELFVPFRRALDDRAEVQHGTGLGLSIARALVRRMGGELTASSEGPGKGSRFVLTMQTAGDRVA